MLQRAHAAGIRAAFVSCDEVYGAWARMRTGTGSKGVRDYDWAMLEVRADDTPEGHDPGGVGWPGVTATCTPSAVGPAPNDSHGPHACPSSPTRSCPSSAPAPAPSGTAATAPTL